MNVQTRKLTTAAVCTALAVIMCAMTAYLPLSFMPLVVAAFCIFLACKRGGAAYGVLCAIASAALMFLMTGLSVKWLLFVVMFAPYGVIAAFADKLVYFKLKTALIRALCAIVYFNVVMGVVYAIAVNVLSVGLDINVAEWADELGGYAVLATVATAILIPLDFLFSALSAVVLKKIPPIKSKAEILNSRSPETPDLDPFGIDGAADKPLGNGGGIEDANQANDAGGDGPEQNK